MRVDAFPESSDEFETAGLARYVKAWHIWRSEGADGLPAAWCATRRIPEAGRAATVITDTADQLAEELAEEARRVELDDQFARLGGGA